ncbi:MAG: serine/threonine-protein kinase [Gemmataceae bacterium]
MASPASRSGVVLALAEEFLERYRKGERPALKEYTDRYPHFADEIREMFPAMAMMENIALADASLAAPASAASERPGLLTQIGDYRVLREVGRGGMGVVYEAEQMSLHRHVALKLLPKALVRDANQRRRFEREARAAARLHHTNIVPVFGVGEDDGQPYYVMQFIRGHALDDVLAEVRRLQTPGEPATVVDAGRSAAYVARSLVTGSFAIESGADIEDTPTSDEPSPPVASPSSNSSLTLPGSPTPAGPKQSYWQSVARLGTQVADALDYAHRQGVLHRDIKPSNLLLDAHGTVWVTDFGLAKTEDHDNLTQTGDLLGTLRYMPPEAFEGKADARGDIYSLGLTLYELLVLRPAFAERDRAKLIKQMTTGEPPRLGDINPAVPRDLQTVIQKAIERDPSHRYANAGELADDLRRFVEDEPIHARTIGPVERTWRWCRRNPVIAGLLAVVVLVTAGGFVATLSQAYAARMEARRADANAEHAQASAAEAHRRTDEADAARRDQERLNNQLRAKQDELRHLLYASDLKLVRAAWEGHNYRRAVELLEKHRPGPNESDVRGFEWYFLKRQLHGEMALRQLPIERLASDHRRPFATFSPDGARVAIEYAAMFAVYDVATGKLVYSRSVPAAMVGGYRCRPLAFSADGRRLVAVVPPEDVGKRPWIARAVTIDLESGADVGSHDIDVGAAWRQYPFAASADGRFLATVCTDRQLTTRTPSHWLLRVVDLSNGQTTIDRKVSPEQRRHWWLDFLADGSTLAIAGLSNGVRTTANAGPGMVAELLDPATGNPRRPGPDLPMALACAVNRDGTRLAYVPASNLTGESTVRLIDLTTNKVLRTWPASTTVNTLEFSADGRRLAGWGAGEVDPIAIVWDAENGNELLTARGHFDRLVAASFSGDGMRLTTLDQGGAVRLWDMSPKPPPAPVVEEPDFLRGPGGFGFRTMVLANDIPAGPWIVKRSGFSPVLRVVNSAGAQVAVLRGKDTDGRLMHVAASDDGRRVAAACVSPLGPPNNRDNGRLISGRTTVIVWSVPDGREICRLRPPSGPMMVGLRFALGGRRLVGTTAGFGAEEAATHVWDADTGVERHTWPIPQGVPQREAPISRDGRRVLVSSLTPAGWEVQVFDLDAEETLRRLAAPGAQLLVLSPDGRRVAGYAPAGPSGPNRDAPPQPEAIAVWDLEIDRPPTLLEGHTSPVDGVAFSADGRRLASVGTRGGAEVEREVRVWDTATGQELVTIDLGPSRGRVAPGSRPIAFGDDGHLSVVGGARSQSLDGSPLPAEIDAYDALFPLALGRLPQSERAGQVASLALDPRLRPAAEALARDWPTDGAWLIAEAWAIAVRPDRQPEEYARAAAYAHEACAGPNTDAWAAYAAALYRLGKYADADEAFRQAATRGETDAVLGPAGTTFRAMTAYRLGQDAKAREALARLRELTRSRRTFNQYRTLVAAALPALTAEAEALIEPKK